MRHCAKPPAGGTLLYSPTAGAGPFSVPQIFFDLDSPDPVGQYLPAPGAVQVAAGGNFFAKEVITLKYQEPQTLGIYVTTHHQDCQYTFRLAIATAKGPVTEDITDKGKPFALTSDGEDGPGPVPFSSYAAVYAGGSADQQHGGKFIRVSPATYHGAGDPGSFPPA
jgi:hypothetical protein